MCQIVVCLRRCIAVHALFLTSSSPLPCQTRTTSQSVRSSSTFKSFRVLSFLFFPSDLDPFLRCYRADCVRHFTRYCRRHAGLSSSTASPLSLRPVASSPTLSSASPPSPPPSTASPPRSPPQPHLHSPISSVLSSSGLTGSTGTAADASDSAAAVVGAAAGAVARQPSPSPHDRQARKGRYTSSSSTAGGADASTTGSSTAADHGGDDDGGSRDAASTAGKKSAKKSGRGVGGGNFRDGGGDGGGGSASGDSSGTGTGARGGGKCAFPGCTTQPRYAANGATRPRFCGLHKLPGQINIVSRCCKHVGCSKVPHFGNDQERPLYCGEHKLAGMVNVANRRCVRVAVLWCCGQGMRTFVVL